MLYSLRNNDSDTFTPMTGVVTHSATHVSLFLSVAILEKLLSDPWRWKYIWWEKHEAVECAEMDLITGSELLF